MYQFISRLIRKVTAELTWFHLILFFGIYLAVTWVLLWLTGETALITPLEFIYYNIVVVSTVGFGDMSPATPGGRLVVALFQIPFGLLIFGAVIGKTTQSVVAIVRKGMNGKKDFSDYKNHILVFGWREHRTKHIIDLILADRKRLKRKIILCVEVEMTHPFPHLLDVEFAYLDSFTSAEELKRIAIAKASSIIIDGSNDEMTLAMALGAASHAPKETHISAYFHDVTKADLLKAHCPNVECASSRRAEILVRTMQVPGSSVVHETLFSTFAEATLYSMTLKNIHDVAVGDVFTPLKQKYDITIMGIADNSMGDGFIINPGMDVRLNRGQVLHYIASERVREQEIDWAGLL